MAKLTALQVDTLRLIRAGSVQNVRFGYGAWRILGASPPAVGVLVRKLKLARWGSTDGDRQIAELTIEGMAALSQQEGNANG